MMPHEFLDAASASPKTPSANTVDASRHLVPKHFKQIGALQQHSQVQCNKGNAFRSLKKIFIYAPMIKVTLSEQKLPASYFHHLLSSYPFSTIQIKSSPMLSYPNPKDVNCWIASSSIWAPQRVRS